MNKHAKHLQTFYDKMLRSDEIFGILIHFSSKRGETECSYDV